MKKKLFILFAVLAVSVLFVLTCGDESSNQNPNSQKPGVELPEYPVISLNEVEHEFQKWALTPPMGWNSYDCFGTNVTEAQVKATAKFMKDNLLKHGWEYVIVDARWFVSSQVNGGYIGGQPNVPSEVLDAFVLDEWGRYLPAVNKFPSAKGGAGFKPLVDHIHSLGLKFGLHIMRGIPKLAVTQNYPVKGANGITANMIHTTASGQQCTWLNENWAIDTSKPGAQEYYNSLFELFAEWGVDYVKIDDISRPYQTADVEMVRNAINKTGRKIVLSLSPGSTPTGSAEHAKNHANMWRTIDDFWDRWGDVAFLLDESGKWAPHIGYGHFPDADMIPLGYVSITGHAGGPAQRPSRLTRNEQKFVMTLLTITRSPLMFGGDFTFRGESFTQEYHNFVLSFLTNREAIYISKGSKNNRQLYNTRDTAAWAADDIMSGDVFLALFYPDTDRPGHAQHGTGYPYEDDVKPPRVFNVNLEELGFTGNVKIRNVWKKEDAGVFSGTDFAPEIKFHGAELYRLSPVN